MNKRNEIGGGYWISQKQIDPVLFIKEQVKESVLFLMMNSICPHAEVDCRI